MKFHSSSLFVVIFVGYFNTNVIGEKLGFPFLRSNGPPRVGVALTINAQKQFIEISFENAPQNAGDHILVTKTEPLGFDKVRLDEATRLARFAHLDLDIKIPIDGYTTTEHNDVEGSGSDDGIVEKSPSYSDKHLMYWVSKNGHDDIVAAYQPRARSQWISTGVRFNFSLSKEVTEDTGCYGYYASYITDEGDILASGCIRAYPRWMNELRCVIEDFRLRDLFIPGTHDSGSYRPNFDPLLHETLVTKYALCQDDDIRGQLMHGARYLDIRVGYYKSTRERFYINHGITRHRPLREVIEQVKEFVLATNEIVIFGLKEFPVGFGSGLAVHRLLVNYLLQGFGDLVAHANATWSTKVKDLWRRHENVILAYDDEKVVKEHPEILFRSVEQRWGNVRTWPNLEQHLRTINEIDIDRRYSRPVADMAELTPDTLDVILDKHGGLRKMADNVNWRISRLYRNELGANANIVAADFIRGTTLMETAFNLNRRKKSSLFFNPENL